MIGLYWYNSSMDFWKFKFVIEAVTCAVCGVWGRNAQGNFLGGIGGRFYNERKEIKHIFSIPIMVNTMEEVEIEAVIYALNLAGQEWCSNKKLNIYTSSQFALTNVLGQSPCCTLNGLWKWSNDLSEVANLFFVPMDFNWEARELARKGLNGPSCFWA